MKYVLQLIELAMLRGGYVMPNALPGYVFVMGQNGASVAFPAPAKRKVEA